MSAQFKQSDETFAAIADAIYKYLDARDWVPTEKDSRNTAISLSLEAGELLEHYQWSEKPVGDKAELASELADVLIYGFQFAQANEIDITDAIRKKLAKQEKKYPVEIFNKTHKIDNETWVKAKVKFNQQRETL